MRARRIEIFWLPAAGTAANFAAWALLDLPGRVALLKTEYGNQLIRADTRPLVLCSAGILVAAWTVLVTTDRPGAPSPLSHLLYYVAFGVLATDTLFFVGAHGRAAAEAGLPGWAFMTVIPAAWCGRHVATRLEDARAVQEAPDELRGRGPTLRLGANERALWVERREGPGGLPALLVGTFIAVVLVATMVANRGLASSVVLQAAFLTACLLYGFATYSVEVTVSEWGVVVRGGAFRVPFWRIPLGEIVEARAEDVDPGLLGGRGYVAKGGRRCLVVRAGPGLLLRRRIGRDVLVSVGRADEGAGLVNALVERHLQSAVRERA